MAPPIERVPLRLLVPLLCVLLLPLTALLWLGSRLLEQDRVLEAKRREEQFERATERAAAEIAQRIGALQRRLECRSAQDEALEGAVIVKFERGKVQRCGGDALPWLPVAQTLPEAGAEVFAAGERAEFAENNPDVARRQYLELSRSPDAGVRAGALLRLARVLRNSRNLAETLPVYASLASVRGVAVTGVPADLVARAARCRILSELHFEEEMRREALALAEDLDKGRWPIDRVAFEIHRDDAVALLNQPRDLTRESIATGVSALYERWRSGKMDGETAGAMAVSELTAFWRLDSTGLFGLVARPAYVQRQVLAGVSGVTVATAPGAKRFPGLPWAIRGEWKEEPGLAEEFAQRRRAMLGFVGIAVLLTAGSALFLWRAFARERALNRLQSDFVSAVSHEFRTPLTNMKQITEVLSEGRLIQEDRRQTYYDSLGRATQRLQRLVESLLDFARMEANAMPYRRDRIILQEMIRGMGNDFTHEFGRSGFRLEMKAPEEPLVVLGDRDALHQALWNLLDNAVKYSPKTRNIWLEAGQHGSLALLRVRDEGIGIPENERRQILKKFVRGEAAKAAGIVGTGLGLSLADHVVRAHGGTLEVESELGKGSRFTILLPLEASCIASS